MIAATGDSGPANIVTMNRSMNGTGHLLTRCRPLGGPLAEEATRKRLWGNNSGDGDDDNNNKWANKRVTV